MRRKVIAGLITIFVFAILGTYLYQYKGSYKIKTSEAPEDVVKKFYAYVGEGGSSSLAEAYKLISTKNFTLTEDKFKGIVLNYSKGMAVKIVGTKVFDDRAVVTIEYKIASTFGGEFTSITDINLDLDLKSKSWKIDFTGETYSSDGQKT
ncbi:MAG: hypothetical protein AAB275_02635 [Deltaproteobacteria bacterium]